MNIRQMFSIITHSYVATVTLLYHQSIVKAVIRHILLLFLVEIAACRAGLMPPFWKYYFQPFMLKTVYLLKMIKYAPGFVTIPILVKHLNLYSIKIIAVHSQTTTHLTFFLFQQKKLHILFYSILFYLVFYYYICTVQDQLSDSNAAQIVKIRVEVLFQRVFYITFSFILGPK